MIVIAKLAIISSLSTIVYAQAADLPESKHPEISLEDYTPKSCEIERKKECLDEQKSIEILTELIPILINLEKFTFSTEKIGRLVNTTKEQELSIEDIKALKEGYELCEGKLKPVIEELARSLDLKKEDLLYKCQLASNMYSMGNFLYENLYVEISETSTDTMIKVLTGVLFGSVLLKIWIESVST